MQAPHRLFNQRVALVDRLTMTTDHLQFAPEILRRLGEELVPQFEHGIVELVRNSYDADARLCQVELVDTDEPGGSIRIIDDGVGMTAEDVRSGWLVLGRSPKGPQTRTRLGRRPVGEKGLGRLSALRMGSRALLISRPLDQLGLEYRLTINWDDFDIASVVEEVPLRIEESSTDKPPGTTIQLEGLRSRLTRRDVQRLARAMVLLADPFDDSHGFRTELVVPSFGDLERRVRNAYFEEATYRLLADLDKKGNARAKVLDHSGTELWSGWVKPAPNTVSNHYCAVPATFEFWTFLLSAEHFSNRNATLTEVRTWLDVVGGVHLYHRGLRVHPYGDPGFDWLEINVSRVRSPEERPSTNNSVGRVIVEDLGNLMLPKTDRTGFVENETFNELKRFAKDALEWMAGERLAESEKRRRTNKLKVDQDRRDAEQELQMAVNQLPLPARRNIEAAASSLSQAADRESQSVREDLQLYRTLASIGTAMTVFAHEADKPVSQIQKMAMSLEARAKKALGSKRYNDTLARPVSVVQKSAQALSSFAALPKQMVRRDKRRLGRVDVHQVIQEMLGLFNAFLSDAKVEQRTEFAETKLEIWGSSAALESILANLIINAIVAFNLPNAVRNSRMLMIRTTSSGDKLLLSVLDNGPGIVGISVDEIWLPGRTTVLGGTGIGLTIAKDAATDLGGTISAVAHGEFGGAEIIIELPILAEEP